MVFTQSSRLASVYTRIKTDAAALPNANTVFIIASPDPDSLCACKMLSSLLKSDCIMHQIIPVSGYDHLAKTNRMKIENNEDLRSIIMLNCGGVIDIASTISIPDRATVYLIDSHRPLHLGSIYLYEQVNVLDDGEIEEMKDVEEAFQAIEMADNANADSEEEGSDDSDEEADGAVEQQPGLELDGDDEEDPFNDGFGDDDTADLNVDGEGSRKRKKPVANANASLLNPYDAIADALTIKRRKRAESRRKRNGYLDILRDYYEEGSYYGMSASQIVYMMLNQVGKVTGDALWLSIVALTDQYLNDRIKMRAYKASALSFREDTTKFDLSGGAAGGSAGNGPADDDAEDPILGGGGGGHRAFADDENDEFALRPLPPMIHGPGGDVRNGLGALAAPRQNTARPRFAAPGMGQFGSKGADDRSIKCVEEFRLMLMRHWSFYDCMFYSQYVAARLGTWKERGRQKLTNLMARMGLPQTQSHQPFNEMKRDIRTDVRQKLLNLGPSFNMTELLFPSFVRQNGYKTAISASDQVYAILALLDCGASWMRRHAVGGVVDESVSEVKVGDSGTTNPGGAASMAARISSAASMKLTGTAMGTRLGAGAVPIKISEFDSLLGGLGGFVEGFEPPIPGEEETERVEREGRNRKRERELEWVKNFYMAYDALDSIDLLYHGIQLSMQFQRVIVKTGISIIEKGMTKTTNTFRFISIGGVGGSSSNHVSSQRSGGMVGENDVSIFGKSVALLNRLAVFLMEAYREHKKKQLPLIVAAFNEDTETHLVIGIPILKRGEVKNQFGLAFLRAAQETNVPFRSDAFDSSVAEIQRDDLVSFVVSLQRLI